MNDRRECLIVSLAAQGTDLDRSMLERHQEKDLMTTHKRARVTARLVAAVEKNDQTIAALAEKHDLHPAQLSALLRGAPAGPSKQARLVKLAKSLGLKLFGHFALAFCRNTELLQHG